MTRMMSSSHIHNTFGSLGVKQGDTYNVSDDCLPILEEILRKLVVEDQTLRTFRRAIGFGQNIRKDLIPLLIYVKDDTKICDATKIIDTTIKILVNLTIPVECLLSIDAVSRTDVGRHTIFELNRLLTTSKEAFTDSRSTKAVVDHMKHVVEKESNLNIQQCDSINNCLLLLRNILHIPENRSISNCPLAHSSMQNEIVWNLFTQSIDKIIIYLMSCPQKAYWGVTMVQLIALMYKDQHVGTLQKLLNLWLEATLSESSEDNESNTSPPDQGSGDSSPIITSDLTSDSSDNGGSAMRNTNTTEVVRAVQTRSKALATMKRVKSTETETSTSSGVSMESTSSASLIQSNKKAVQQSSQSEISDCGYVTQVENQESISTSSNDDDQPHTKPIHQKPHTFQKTRYNRATVIVDKKELRRKKLVKRSKTNFINMKGLMHHTPTDEDISNILKEFTVDFLLKGYGSLVHDLHTQLLTNIHVPIDTSHFFWLVTYFLKFATQLELDLDHITPILSYEIISYLIFQGVWLYEELEVSCNIPDIDLKPCLRRIHLVVTAIREFLQAVETYAKLSHLSEEDKHTLQKLQKQIAHTEDLKRLFLLLLRQFNPKLHSRQYLQDLIITNHNYLLFLDTMNKEEKLSIDIMDHLKQFATVEIMRQYGLLLEGFTENGEYINNCVFTMMHHIGGDLEHISTLFQPSILKTFSQIWETDYEICDDWSDLIEYVIHKFINTPRTNCSNITSPVTPPLIQDREDKLSTPPLSSSSEKNEWTQEEKDTLFNYYIDSKDDNDTIASITRKYVEDGVTSKSHQVVVKELLEQQIISQDQFDGFVKLEQIEKVFDEPTLGENLINGDIKVLMEYLYRDNKGCYIVWLQNTIIDACFAKLVITNPELYKDIDAIMEPSIYYYAQLHLPIPIVSWTFEQCNILKHQPFVLLLNKLGFYLPSETGKTFVRIPNFWTANYLYSIAQQLAPIDTTKVKFDISLLEGRKTEIKTEPCSSVCSASGRRRFSLTELKHTPSIVRYTPLPNSAEWVQTILHTKVASVMDSSLKIPSNRELSITIPDIETLPCSLMAPKLTMAVPKTTETLTSMHHSDNMDISPSEEESPVIINDDIEHNSNCETESVTSDLTRMCVSDEDEKPVVEIIM